MTDKERVRQYKLFCGLLWDALGQYADPSFYQAILLVPDPPCGEFINDVSFVDDYWRDRPGKLARETLADAQERFGGLTIIANFPA